MMDQVNDGGAQYLSNFHVVTKFMEKKSIHNASISVLVASLSG